MRAHTFSGGRLKELRNLKRLTQHDLASELRKTGFGTTQTTVSRWEDGQQPQSSVLPALALILGVSIGELFSEDDDEEAASMGLTGDQRDLLAALAHALARFKTVRA
jgi:transcriptional regulator with XRE-family HTH domain